MTLSTRDVIGIILGGAMFLFYVSNTRPVGWFDSVVGLLLFAAVFQFAHEKAVKSREQAANSVSKDSRPTEPLSEGAEFFWYAVVPLIISLIIFVAVGYVA